MSSTWAPFSTCAFSNNWFWKRGNKYLPPWFRGVQPGRTTTAAFVMYKSVFSEHCSLSLFILSRKDRWKTEGMERSQDQEESVGETPWVFILLSLSFIWDVITFTFFFLRLGKTKDVKENQRRKEEVRHDVEACIKYGQMGLSESASWSNLDLNLKQPSTIANTLNLCLSRVFVSYL